MSHPKTTSPDGCSIDTARAQAELRSTDLQLRWRKKPVVIEAVQVTAADYNGHTWDGEPFLLNGTTVPEWLGMALQDGTLKVKPSDRDYALWAIETREGVMVAEPGDWIIRGIKGELYPCKPDIFEATYEPA